MGLWGTEGDTSYCYLATTRQRSAFCEDEVIIPGTVSLLAAIM